MRPAMSWPSSEYRYFRYSSATARVPFLSTTLSTTATLGSARMEIDGTTISNFSGPNSFSARKASFSQASSTSPTPRCTKVMVEPRAPVSSTGTFLYRLPTNSLALASPPYLRLANSQAAR
ncbi:hypothetical protein D9M68_752110 [compost metagenome]